MKKTFSNKTLYELPSAYVHLMYYSADKGFAYKFRVMFLISKYNLYKMLLFETYLHYCNSLLLYLWVRMQTYAFCQSSDLLMKGQLWKIDRFPETYKTYDFSLCYVRII